MMRPFSLLTPTAQSFIHSSSQQDTAPMNPIFLHPPSPLTLLSNTNEETILDQQPPHLVQDQQHLLLFTPTKPSFPYPIFFDTNQRQEHDDPDDNHDFNYQEDEEEGQVEEQFARVVRNSNFPPPPSHPILINPKIEISKMDSQDEEHVPGSVNSTSCLKERIANPDQTVPIKPLRKRHHYYCPPQLSSINNNSSGRVCSDCNTTKTPLWRSGPQGPKSLCNACGIRHRKARRAMAAAAAGATNVGLDKDVAMKKKVHKDKRVDPKFTTQYRKRCKIATTPTRKKLCIEMDFDTESNSSSNLHYSTKKSLDFSVGLSKSSGDFHRVFPEDEHEAAILLMALSCGLFRSR